MRERQIDREVRGKEEIKINKIQLEHKKWLRNAQSLKEVGDIHKERKAETTRSSTKRKKRKKVREGERENNIAVKKA